MILQNDKVEILFKVFSLFALPAFFWALSLSAERARIDERLNHLESRLKLVESSLNEASENVTKLIITAQYIREDLKELKEGSK